MTPNGKYKATCNLCGKDVTEFPMLDIPIIGEPDAKAKKVLTILGTHIATKHGDQFAAGMHLLQDFQAFLILTQFATQDPSIQTRAETVRAGMQALTRKYTFSDRHIEQGVLALENAGQLNSDTVQQLIRTMRDVLTEQGQYAPQIEKPQSSLIV